VEEKLPLAVTPGVVDGDAFAKSLHADPPPHDAAVVREVCDH
jgi:hypothetical protein